jgi:hypothetical protein
MDERTPRELDSREKTERTRQWRQPDLLPEPDKDPNWIYRWIRVSMLNSPDPRNISAKLREGWEPVTVKEQPKFRLLVDPNSRFKDNIEVGGLLLCKTPRELAEQRNEFYAKQATNQMESVDNSLMRQSDPRMPLFKERKSSTSFGKGV